MQLVISNNDSFAPLSLDLTNYIQVSNDEMDPADPSFTDKIISHSLLKEGGVLALEDLKNKELVFPLSLNVPNVPAAANLIQDPNLAYDTYKLLGWPYIVETNATITSVLKAPAYDAPTRGQIEMSSSSGAWSAFVFTAPLPVTANAEYYLAAILTAGELVVQWTTSGGTVTQTVSTCSSGGAQQLLSGTVTAPANVISATVGIGMSGTGSGNSTLLFGEVMMVAGGPRPYFDGDSPGACWTGIPGLSASEMLYGPSGAATLVQQINQILSSPGATASWQDDAMTEPTVFDLISGQFDITYNYRREQKAWIDGKLRLFAQPLGGMGAPRLLATASGPGPLLLISPYAYNGSVAVTPTQNSTVGVSGTGGPGPNGGGMFFADPAKLRGDAPAQLLIGYQGPISTGASFTGVTPYVAVSVLPDQAYQPLFEAASLGYSALSLAAGASATIGTSVASDAPGGEALSIRTGGGTALGTLNFFAVPGGDESTEPTARWAGQHRIFALARASASGQGAIGGIEIASGPLGQHTVSSAVPMNAGWNVVDLGTIALNASQYPQTPVEVEFGIQPSGNGGGYGAIDIAAIVMLPDANTWFLNPTAIPASQYGYPAPVDTVAPAWNAPVAPWSNTLIIDDTLGVQGIFQPGLTSLNPVGAQPFCGDITAFSRGLMPQPDPADGVPIIAILGVGQTSGQTETLQYTNSLGMRFAASVAPFTSNPLNQTVAAELYVLERTRYVFA